MTKGVVQFTSSPRCGFQSLAVVVLLIACLPGHAYGSCLSYGHSCWGAHGKRNGGHTLLEADGSSVPISSLAPHQSSSSSSPSTSDPEALWLLSKLMATKQLLSNDKGGEDGLSGDSKEFNVWQRLLDAKKQRKHPGPLQTAENDRIPYISSFEDDRNGLSLDNRKGTDEIERRNSLVSGDEEDDLSQYEGEEEPTGDEDYDQDTTSETKTRDGRKRYRYKIQKHWANRRKNRFPPRN